MDWIKNNLIIILLIALGATFVFGSLGTLWYRNKAEKADLRAQVAEASLATCDTVNKGFADSVGRQEVAVKRLEDAGKNLEANAAKVAAAAKTAAQGEKNRAAALRNFTPETSTASKPCAAEHSVIDEFFRGRGSVR